MYFNRWLITCYNSEIYYTGTWILMYWSNSSFCLSSSAPILSPSDRMIDGAAVMLPLDVTEELCSSSSYDSFSPVDTGFWLRRLADRSASSWEMLYFKEIWCFCRLEISSASFKEIWSFCRLVKSSASLPRLLGWSMEVLSSFPK